MTEPEVVPEEVRRLRLEPGDRLIVRVSDRWTNRQIHEYGEWLRAKFPDNEPVIIVGEEIAVERAANANDEMSRLAEEVAERLTQKLQQALPRGGVKVMPR